MSTLHITERDYYAAKVLNGIYSNEEISSKLLADWKQDKNFTKSPQHYIARFCYIQANAMLQESKL